MAAERAGYTVTMFVIDVGSTMAKTRLISLPDATEQDSRTTEMTNLEWALQFVLYKVEEQIFNERKTDKCGIILVGTDDTKNSINDERPEEYLNITEFIPIVHPTPDTLQKITKLQPSQSQGDVLDGIIVALNAQSTLLQGKNTWTRKLIVITDGETPMSEDGWKSTRNQMNEWGVKSSIIGIDFDDEEYGFQEESKSEIKIANEAFWRKATRKLNDALLVTCEYALVECAKPDVKETKSQALQTVLRLGEPDDEDNAANSISISIRTSKATAIKRPPTMKRFIRHETVRKQEDMDWEATGEVPSVVKFAPLIRRTDLYVDTKPGAPDGEDASNPIKVESQPEETDLNSLLYKQDDRYQEVIEDDVQYGYKYGSTYIPAPSDSFDQLGTKKGLDIIGFIPERKFRREWAMGEIYYVWSDKASAKDQLSFSSIVQAMKATDERGGLCAIIRMVTAVNRAPKLGIAVPREHNGIDCLLWVQMPFAEDHRNYSFPSLERLYNKKGQQITTHPNLPTESMNSAMDNLVDCMDLSTVKTEYEGTSYEWFDNLYSYNPAVHRVKQALYHAAIAPSLATHPLPPPHSELTKYFEPPSEILEASRDAVTKCQKIFAIKPAPAKGITSKKETYLVEDRDEDLLILAPLPSQPKQIGGTSKLDAKPLQNPIKSSADDDLTEPEDEDMKDLEPTKIDKYSPVAIPSLPTPARSPSPLISLERELEPGRIIGTIRPLDDFKGAISQGDLVTEATQQLGEVICQITVQPFGNRRKSELLDAMKYLRDTCLKEDEIETWNLFLQELKNVCLKGNPAGNPSFWNAVKEQRILALITDQEAKALGGVSSITKEDATKFMEE